MYPHLHVCECFAPQWHSPMENTVEEILQKSGKFSGTPVGIDQTRTSLDISHINLSIPLCQMFLHHPFRIPSTSFHSNYNSKVWLSIGSTFLNTAKYLNHFVTSFTSAQNTCIFAHRVTLRSFARSLQSELTAGLLGIIDFMGQSDMIMTSWWPFSPPSCKKTTCFRVKTSQFFAEKSEDSEDLD